MKAVIMFKTKLKEYSEGGKYFRMKQSVSRHDLENIRELSGHWGINSDLMPQIIRRGIFKLFNTENYPEYVTVNTMPPGIDIKEGFLSEIRITIDI